MASLVTFWLTICRILSAILGRPAMISAADVVSLPFPAELEEDLLQSSNFGGTYFSRLFVITFFVLSIKLFELVQRILSAFYAGGVDDSATNYSRFFTDTASVLAFDNQILLKCQSVPQHLKLDDDDSSLQTSHAADTFKRQATVLKVRYLHARI